MSTPTRPRYYLFGLSPITVLSFPLWFPALGYVAIILYVFLVVPPGQQSEVAEEIGYAIGNGFVNLLALGGLVIAAHTLISMIVGWIFALCYFAIQRLLA